MAVTTFATPRATARRGRCGPADVRTLQLMRHAKSSWDDPSLDDRDRPLNRRGRDAADSMGARLAAAGAAPGLILCSTAARARETCDRLVAAFAVSPPRRFDDRLYLASAGRVLALLRGLDGAPLTVMVVGHNPGMQALASALAVVAAPTLAERWQRKFPTAALAAFDFAGSWRDLDSAAVTAVRADTPKSPRQGNATGEKTYGDRPRPLRRP